MAELFVVFYHLHGKFVDYIIKRLFCMEFFTYCGFPSIFIDTCYPQTAESKAFLCYDAQALAQTPPHVLHEGISTLWCVSKLIILKNWINRAF